MTKISKPAETTADLNPLIQNRFSPRIYDVTKEISAAELMSLGEAFRWAPSSSNQQPWRLVLATRGSELFEQISRQGLTGFNQSWAPSASCYAVVLANKSFEGKPREQAGTFFDAGLASQQLVIQAEHMGMRAHYMGGIVRDEIARIVGADDHWVICVIAVGYQGELEGHDDAIIERERAARTRFAAEQVYSVNQRIG